MHTYSAYGLTIASAFPLPELRDTAPGHADVRILLDRTLHPAEGEEHQDSRFRLASRDALLCWDGIGRFRVRNGEEILIDPSPGAEEALVRLPLLGAVMAVLLYQRGHLVLHASAVAVNGEAILFLGAKGQGKSTLAAAFLSRGHTLVADDVVGLDLQTGEVPVARIGMPHIKLWADAVSEVIGQDPSSLSNLHSQSEKRYYRGSPDTPETRLPVRQIYTLAEGSPPAIAPLPPREALQQIVGHSYIARFGRDLLSGEEARSHFLQCVELATKVPVCRLRRRLSFRALPHLVERIEQQATRSGRHGAAEPCLAPGGRAASYRAGLKKNQPAASVQR